MSASSPDRQVPGGRCPICGRPTQVSYRPFCSRRCADIDLARWLKGRYAIPGEERVDADENTNTDTAGKSSREQGAGGNEDA